MVNNLPSVHRWYSEDYSQSPDWFKRFLGSFNLFSEPMYNILNGGVDVTANTNEEIYFLQIPNASATPTENTFLFSPKKFVGIPRGVIIAQCVWNVDTGIATAIGNPVTFDWVWTGSQISILAIYGLSADEDYSLTLRIF